MIKKSVFMLLLLTILFSGKKDRLNGDLAILEGNWEWVYSIKYSHSLSSPFLTSSQTILPSDVSSSYGLEFLKQGKVLLIENNETKDKYRTVFTTFESSIYCDLIGNDSYDFVIDVNNGENYPMRGCVNSDTLVIYYKDFPLPSFSNSNFNVNYKNFFKRVD